MGVGVWGKEVVEGNKSPFREQSEKDSPKQWPDHPQGNDDSHFELITPQHYIKALRLQCGSLEEHLLEISTERPDMIAKKAAWGEVGRDHCSAGGNG